MQPPQISIETHDSKSSGRFTSLCRCCHDSSRRCMMSGGKDIVAAGEGKAAIMLGQFLGDVDGDVDVSIYSMFPHRP